MSGSKTIVFFHGAWVTPASWGAFVEPFRAAGYTVHTPAWPGLGDRSAAEINADLPPDWGSLTVGRIADHFQAFIEALPEAPILVGHSFGGLIVQMLLDRGVGVAGVALNPVLIGGIVPGPTTLGFALPILLRWNGWNRPWSHSRESWADRLANGAPPEQQRESYDTYVIPAPGRIFYQAAFWAGTFIKPKRRTAPLLITGGGADRLVTPYLSHEAWQIQRGSKAQTRYKFFEGRSHLLCAEPGWEEVAEVCLTWIGRLQPRATV